MSRSNFTLFLSLAGFLIICFGMPGSTVTAQRDLEAMKRLNANMRPPMEIDEELLADNGIFKIEGKHVVIYTDIRDDPSINELARVFDLAVPQWCEYFGIDPEKAAGWQVSGFIIADKPRFKKANLFPRDLPDFLAGFNRDHHMWVYLQPGNYYTRHLLLHEGTHSFMQWFLGGNGPPWYSEGMAEMLAVHRWVEGELELNYRLRNKEEAEMWGRVKIIREDFDAGEDKSLTDVFRIPNVAFRSVRNYAWAWAACKFFSQHPLARAQFSNLGETASDLSMEFSREFYRNIGDDWSQLEKDWKLFITEMDYGIQIEQLNVTEAGEVGGELSIDATRGWQRTRIAVKAGETISISATGRYQIANIDKPWPCEPGGVTLEYYRGHPLGMLMAGVVSEDADVDGLLNPQPIGLEGTFTAKNDGLLCFRVNESPAKLDDNSGSLQVNVTTK